MQYRTFSRLTATAAVFCGIVGASAYAQSTGQFTQTVNKAPTVTEFTMPTGVLPEQNVTLKAIVNTGISTSGIAAPTSTVTFKVDGSTVIGTPTVTSETSTNLLSYSELFFKWSLANNAAANPTVTDQSAVGPFGTTDTPNGGNTASAVVFPDTTIAGALSSLSSQVTGTSYAGKSVVLSVWAKAATATTLKLIIADGSGGNATATTMNVGTAWRRFHVQATLPAGAASGLEATIESTGSAAATVDLFGAQAEADVATQGVYVQTTGTGGIAGAGSVATLSCAYTVGAHTTSVSYGGDTSYLGSDSNALNITAAKATAALTLASSLNPTIYGQNTTFTAGLTGDGTPWASPGVITISAGGTTLKSCNVTAAVTTPRSCTVTTDALVGGSDVITATYTGDPNYSNASASVTQVVAAAAAAVSMTSTPEPSVYGQNVAFTISVAGVGGLAVPTGTVTVVDNGSCTSSCTGGTTIANGLTLTAGSATFSNALLTGGTHNFVITFTAADPNYK